MYNTVVVVLVSDLDKICKSELPLGNNSSLRQFSGTLKAGSVQRERRLLY